MRNKIKNKRKDPVINQFLFLRLASITLFGLFIFIVGFTTFFIHQTIEAATTQAQQIIIIKSELSIEAINFEKFDKISLNWNQKHNPELPILNNNPFAEKESNTPPEQNKQNSDENPSLEAGR